MLSPELEAYCKDVNTRRSRVNSQDCPWCNGMDYEHKSTFMCMHRELLDFTKWILPTEQEKHIRYLVIKRLRSAVSVLWPEAKIVPTGSTATGTFLPNGDIDFVIFNAPDTNTDIDLLEQLNDHLNSMSFFHRSEVIHAKCPIIKGVEKPFNFKIDIAINNLNGILNIRRVTTLFSEYPQLVPLMMFFKLFLYEFNLDEPFHGGISSNSLLHLVLFVVQSSSPESRQNLGRLLHAFLNIFGNSFNYITTGISTKGHGALFSRIRSGRVSMKTPVSLSIEDPQISGEYLGENAFETLQFRNECREAFDRLNRAQGPEQSVLLRIISFPSGLVRVREDLARQYRSLSRVAADGFLLDSRFKEAARRQPHDAWREERRAREQPRQQSRQPPRRDWQRRPDGRGRWGGRQ